MNKAWVIIPAAGVGQRMQSDIPKQYIKIHEQTVIEHTLDCFIHHPKIAGIVVALHPNDPYWSELTINSPMPVHSVDGGRERSDSVFRALCLLTDLVISEQDYVLVHDAARPCLSRQDLDLLLDRRSLPADNDGAILALPVRDTMKRGVLNNAHPSEHVIDRTVERNNLWHALTPQMFRVGSLKQALIKARKENIQTTDEASAIEFIGGNPALVEGSASNIKITRQADLKLAEFFLSTLTHSGSSTDSSQELDD